VFQYLNVYDGVWRPRNLRLTTDGKLAPCVVLRLETFDEKYVYFVIHLNILRSGRFLDWGVTVQLQMGAVRVRRIRRPPSLLVENDGLAEGGEFYWSMVVQMMIPGEQPGCTRCCPMKWGPYRTGGFAPLRERPMLRQKPSDIEV
jgi:hypothetical protein